RPRVGSARIATVTAAVDGTSSSSQKLAANATTTASQMRIPKAQEPAGTPAKRNGGSIAVVVMRNGRSRLALARPIGLVVATAAVAEEDERHEANGESHREKESERQRDDALATEAELVETAHRPEDQDRQHDEAHARQDECPDPERRRGVRVPCWISERAAGL